MHRTQVILEDKQYSLLKKMAAEEKKSMSGLIREIIDNYTRKTGVFSLSNIEAVAEDEELYGRDHDSVLYERG